ncbi:MAG: ester cyclase [Actinobacteria bacterium]|nr:MAG: ester cyclase [Actinomycetota bacterium]
MDGQELQDFIDRYNDAWNDHDVETIVSMHTDDSVFENHVTGDVNVGREQIARAIQGIFSVFPDLRFETRRAYIREDLVVQEWTARGTHEGTMTRSGIELPPTGRKVDYKGMDVIPIRDGLVARKDVYSDSVTLLRQLGLTAIEPTP